MLTDNEPELLQGVVEVDETYVGGKERNKHASKRAAKNGVDKKTMVLGAVQRGGKIRTKVIAKTNIENVSEAITEFIKPDSTMVTDEHHAYNRVGLSYDHRTVSHNQKEYVRYEEIKVHTNTIEGFWNILKKQIIGIHHSVSAKHLQRYCNESAFRYNRRKVFQDERFSDAVFNCNRTLKYKTLIGKYGK